MTTEEAKLKAQIKAIAENAQNGKAKNVFAAQNKIKKLKIKLEQMVKLKQLLKITFDMIL